MSTRLTSRGLAALVTALVVLGAAAAAQAQAGLTLSGETRIRYETLEGQFRARGAGGDQILAVRTLAKAEFEGKNFAAGIELQDSRAELDDQGTPLSTSLVDPLDVLQAYVRLDVPAPIGFDESRLTLGRQTISIGSRRVIERVEFANVIFSYTGAYWRSDTTDGDELHILAVAPLARQPTSLDDLRRNRLSADEESWNRTFWGVHYRRANAFGALLPDTWGETFLYGLNERDSDDLQTPNRQYLQPGIRFYRAPKVGRVDFDIEAAVRRGARRASTLPTDRDDLTVRASTLHAAVGFSPVHPWMPRLSLDYDYASGDRNPADGVYGQYERLFGSRRTDLGNTSLFGPWTPANLVAPGGRLEIAPHPQWDARISYKAGFLASARDVWTVARLRDASGTSGKFVGHTIDARARYRFKDRKLDLEVGASLFSPGEFAKSAPNSPGETTLFGYIQMLSRF